MTAGIVSTAGLHLGTVCGRPGCGAPLPEPDPRGGRPARWCSATCRKWGFRHVTKPRNRSDRHAVHYSSATEEWGTPPELFAELAIEWGPFDLDVCASAVNAKCGRYFDRLANALVQRWRGRCWMNPPYGDQIGAFMDKAAGEVARGNAELVCCLVPARTDTAWWHAAMAHQPYRRFLRGRVRFVRPDARHAAPFPSAVVVFRAAPTPGAPHALAPASPGTPPAPGR